MAPAVSYGQRDVDDEEASVSKSRAFLGLDRQVRPVSSRAHIYIQLLPHESGPGCITRASFRMLAHGPDLREDDVRRKTKTAHFNSPSFAICSLHGYHRVPLAA